MLRFLFVFILFLTGCGFHPLYQDYAVTQDKTKTVYINPINDFGGYIMSNRLSEILNPTGADTQKLYQLDVQIQKPHFSDQSIRGDNFASLEEITVTVKYKLVETATDTVVLNSYVRMSGSYNIIESPYATTVARDKTYERLLDSLADEIGLHIITYFKEQNR